jgi:hypothetical protein
MSSGKVAMDSADDDLDPGEIKAAAWALIGVALPPESWSGVGANLAILGRHLAVVRSVPVPATTEAAEVFQA